MLCLRSALLYCGIIAIAAAHEDLLGTHYVTPNGIDAGDCRHSHEPCRTLTYAHSQSDPGDLIKVAEGAYPVNDLTLDRLFFGPVKIIGGYSAADGFKVQSAAEHRTTLIGGGPYWDAVARARGFHFAATTRGTRRAASAPPLSFDIIAATQAAAAVAPSACVQGRADDHPCKNVDLLAHMRLVDFSSRPASASNIWGFVDRNDQREYVVIGLENGTAVIEITDPAQPREVGTILSTSSLWREPKIYQFFDEAANRYRAYAYITTEAPQTGLEIIDLSDLPNSVSLAGRLMEFGSAHTLYVSNVEYAGMTPSSQMPAFLYIAGANLNDGAFRIYALEDPLAPRLVTTAPAGTQYMHDSTSLLVTDERSQQCAAGHNPCEVLVDFNENSVDLWDVTAKAQPVRLSSTTYPQARYTHSGWPSADGRFLFVHDELDELRIGNFQTHIYTMDIADLTAPRLRTSFVGETTSTDHNGFTKGDFYYVSHYRRGLVVFDVSDPNAMREVAHFDTFLNPAADVAGTDGAWGVYPFFPSGAVVISDIDNGLFVLRDHAQDLDVAVGRVGFDRSSQGTDESAGRIDVVVRRVGGRQGPIEVTYRTVDETATAGDDYDAATGVLSWEAGDDSDRIVSVTLREDVAREGSEAFSLELQSTAQIDGAASLPVTIQDNDASIGGGAAGRGGGGGGSFPAEMLWLALLALWRQGFSLRGLQGASRRERQ